METHKFIKNGSPSAMTLGLISGSRNHFEYHGHQFRVQKNGHTFEIEWMEHKHKALVLGGLFSFLDFQVVASVLINEKRDIRIDEEGNLI